MERKSELVNEILDNEFVYVTIGIERFFADIAMIEKVVDENNVKAYYLWNHELGGSHFFNLGRIEFYKLPGNRTSVKIIYPYNTDESMDSGLNDNQKIAWLSVYNNISEYTIDQIPPTWRENYLRLMDHMINRLQSEGIWKTKIIDTQSTRSNAIIETLNPKHKIIIELWQEGYSAKEIATKIDRSSKTVLNIVSFYRGLLGTNTVPYRRGTKLG